MDCLLRVFFSHSINDSKNSISSENKALKVTQLKKTVLKYMFYQKALTFYTKIFYYKINLCEFTTQKNDFKNFNLKKYVLIVFANPNRSKQNFIIDCLVIALNDFF